MIILMVKWFLVAELAALYLPLVVVSDSLSATLKFGHKE